MRVVVEFCKFTCDPNKSNWKVARKSGTGWVRELGRSGLDDNDSVFTLGRCERTGHSRELLVAIATTL